MNPAAKISDLLELDCAAEAGRIEAFLRNFLQKNHRRGLVIGLSGGVDSTVTAALAVRALGRDRVFGLLMPEQQSDPVTLPLSRKVVDWLGITFAIEEITSVLEAAGFTRRYVAAARQVIADFDSSWKSKVIIHAASGAHAFNYFQLVAQAPDGRTETVRLPLTPYLELIAATSFKQRTRKMFEYHHADRLNYAVAGTPNRLEYDQGFFVKNGDGSADVKPIAHLYKSQVYQLAEFLDVPPEIRERPPTTDTYTLPQGQDEFYFALPYRQMDVCLYGKDHGFDPEIVATAAGLDRAMVEHAWADIDRKRATTRYLHRPPAVVEEIPGVPPGN